VSLKGHGRECGGVFLPTTPGVSGLSPCAPGYATDSILRDHYLQHEESVKLDSWDLEISLPRADSGFVPICMRRKLANWYRAS
jgi:hypothetical protein